MSDREIAEKIIEIAEEFQKQAGLSDDIINNIVRHCFRKMELASMPAEYILLMLPDELKNACFRNWTNWKTMELTKKEVAANVQYV